MITLIGSPGGVEHIAYNLGSGEGGGRGGEGGGQPCNYHFPTRTEPAGGIYIRVENSSANLQGRRGALN